MTSWAMSVVGQIECADFVVRHHLQLDNLYSHRRSLDQVVDAYREFDRQSAGKAVIVFDG